MAPNYPTTHSTGTTAADGHARRRAVRTVLTLALVTPLALVTALIVVGALASAGSLTSVLTAFGLLAAPVLAGTLLRAAGSSDAGAGRNEDGTFPAYGLRLRR
jgi:hypothetical protein